MIAFTTNLSFKNNYLLIIFTCLTAGVVEELLMRGYIQSRIEKIYANRVFWDHNFRHSFGILHSTYGTISQVLVMLSLSASFLRCFIKFIQILKF
ncbi:CPBP family glutamic-type intramembrane protease [Chryseobacterium wanjuense]